MSDDMIDYLAIALCLYIFVSTYRQKRELSYKITWFIPFIVLLFGSISDLLGFDLGDSGNLIFKVVFYTTIGWALIYSFAVTAYIRKKHNQSLKNDAKDSAP